MINDSTLYGFLEKFIYNATSEIDKALAEKRYVSKYDKYPDLKFRSNGMPDIGEHGELPINIQSLFQKYSGKADIVREEIEGYSELRAHLKQHTEFRSLNSVLIDSSDLFDTMVDVFILNILERYYVQKTGDEGDKNLLLSIYTPLENYIYAERISFDISAPILFAGFEFEEFAISENVIIRKISDGHHKARVSIKSYSPPVTSALISSATHELVLKDYSTIKPKNFSQNSFSDESVYPHDKFESFFNALKICTNISTGYAQVLIYPHDWVDSYKLDLPCITGTSVKKYPNWFDNFYWNAENLPSISIEQANEIKNICSKILTASDNKLKIACKRLRYSYFRDNEEDSILDILIALEALLCDGDKGEITHKLSMRIARLLGTFTDDYESIAVFESMKKIYAFRSAVVHGSSAIESKREIKIPDIHTPIRTISLASDYLRATLKVMIDNPLYLNPKEIDKLMIANSTQTTQKLLEH